MTVNHGELTISAFAVVFPEYFTVVQPNLIDFESSAAGLQVPDIKDLIGMVTFTPSVSTVQSATLDSTVVLKPINGYFLGDGRGLVSCTTDMGTPVAGVKLVDNLGLGLAAGALTYRVDYQLNVSQNVGPFRFAAPGNAGTVDLNNPANWIEL